MTKVTTHKFSQLSTGGNAQVYRLDNGAVQVDLSDYGATVLAVRTPDKDGNQADIVLGYGTVAEYQKNGGYFGATVGRYANRIGKGKFTLNGTAYTLAQNDGANHLHGGIAGFDKKLWACEIVENGVKMSLVSPDGEEGYPGALTFSVLFTLDDTNTLTMRYEGLCDADTVLNPTNHAYFNLCGHGKGDVLRHKVKIAAEQFTRVDQEAIPTGELPAVADTRFDFRDFHEIGERLTLEDTDLAACGGYDHNFVIAGYDKTQREVAVLHEDYTGRTLTVSTDLPGIQLYIGNMIDPVAGKENAHYGKRSGLCLETQFFPDSPNQPSFPSCVCKKNVPFCSVTAWRFSVEE